MPVMGYATRGFERGAVSRGPVARFRERGKRMKIYAIEYFNFLCIAYLILIIWARNVAWFFWTNIRNLLFCALFAFIEFVIMAVRLCTWLFS